MSERPASAWWLVFLAIACISAWTGCAGPTSQTQPSPAEPPPTAVSGPQHQAVGDFRLRDRKGDEIRLSDYAGKVVLVSFWATWCDPCQIELPQLQAIWERNRDRGLILLTISVDTADKESDVRQLVRRYRYRFPVLLDQSSEVTNRFHPTMELPYSMLLDPAGHIVASHQGYRPGDEETIEREIRELLPQ